MNAKMDGLVEEKHAKDKQITELTATLKEFMAAKVCSDPHDMIFCLAIFTSMGEESVPGRSFR